MDLTAPLTLHPDALIIPSQQVDAETRARIGCADDDFVVSRPLARTSSRVVDALGAELLERFREPRTIVEAVILFSHRHGLKPGPVLEDAFPMLRGLLAGRLLVPAGDPEGEAGGELGSVVPGLAPGERVAGVEVMRPLHLLEDTELYQVRTAEGPFAVLKIRRPGAPELAGSLAIEAAVLRRLDGVIAPAALATGEHDGRPYLLLEWCPGIDPVRAAAEFRGRPGPAAHERLRALAAGVAEAYARLHHRGVVHGDVHPANVLVDGQGGVRLVDFGLARCPGEGEAAPLLGGGVPFFYPPELAAALLAGEVPPPATETSEQHAVGALLYVILTGEHYLGFDLAREAMLRQIVSEPPRAFADCGVEPWPAVEAVLGRALAKDPGDRFPSLAELASALASAPVPEPKRRARPEPPVPAPLERLGDRLLAALDLENGGLEHDLAAPTASVTYGAAGVAWTLYRIATRRDDPRLLALADLWAARAARAGERADGFYNPEIEITREVVGESSPYHTASGIHAVRAMIARAMADPLSQERQLRAFLAASSACAAGLDLTLGRCATLLAASLLVDTLPAEPLPAAGPLHDLGRDTLAGLWRRLDAMPAIPEAEIGYLGIAHGWAGFLYATLHWCRASGDPPPAGCDRRLAELAALAEPTGRGLTWPIAPRRPGRPPATMPGWCNGGAGHLFLWCLAHRLTGEPEHRRLGEGAAWEVWDAPESYGSLCCGLAGRSYALLAHYRLTGDDRWLARARTLARRAAESHQLDDAYPHSLYKGELGLALLAADLERPEEAAMPFFEDEGWPVHRDGDLELPAA
jgi:serine/threonine-protein kinase